MAPGGAPLETGRGAHPSNTTVERRLAVMGTSLRLSVEAADRAAALEASEAAAREIERAERLLSTWKRGGPLDRLNRAAPGASVDIGEEAAGLLQGVFQWRSRTEGAFDPTVLPLVRAWDLRGAGRVASPEEIARAVEATGTAWFELDSASGLAARLHPGAGIDEGAWGKGYALDLSAAALRRCGIRRATVDLGGQLMVLGADRVAIADPRDRGRAAVRVAVENASISTSGNSERARTVEGRRIGHLLDPRTGSPAPDFGSATAVADSALVADVLSTAFFVMGPRQGLALSERLRSEGFPNEAIFLVVSGGRVRCLTSPGLKQRLVEGEMP